MLNFRICIKIISKNDIYFRPRLFISTNCCKVLSKGFWIEKGIVSCFLFFLLIHTTALDKMQVEEVHDFFFQKITYEEISAILQGIYPSVREYSVKLTKIFCRKKKGIFSRIFQDHVRTIISETVAVVQKNFYKTYFFE